MRPLRIGSSWFQVAAAAILAATSAAAAPPADLSRWHGFNLLEKFKASSQSRYVEDDFRWIRELGFNFVRLPIDYRCYAVGPLSTDFREDVLREIDEAVEFGRRHGVHVCLNLHRAPGFCINPPEEPTSLWTDAATLAAFVAHWEMWARRYKGRPSSEVSFNLLNEPTRCSREDYVRVHRRAIEAIHAIDPDRLVIVDGYSVGHEPCPEFLSYSNVAQATRGYHPGTISHYRAGWVKGSDRWPVPTWPRVAVNGYLYGPVKPDLRSPLVLEGQFPAGTEVALWLDRACGRLTVAFDADGQEVARMEIHPAADTNAWIREANKPNYAIHRTRTPMPLRAILPAGAQRVAARVAAGDWLTFRELSIRLPGGEEHRAGADSVWGATQRIWRVAADGRLLPPSDVSPDAELRDRLRPWIEIAARGEEVFVGEFGCYNKTPHDVALAWMESWLRLWKEAGIGRALWNFRGSFGILDSGRKDVDYEDWRGHKLDRKMLTLLQTYLPDSKPARSD